MDPYTTLATTLADNDYSSQLTELKAWLADLVPGIDTEGPVFNALLLQPLAARQAVNENLVRVLRDYSLLKDIPLDSIVDEDLRTEIRTLQAEELGLSAIDGSAASGVLTLTYADNASRIFPVGSVFSSTGGVAITTQSYILRSAEELTGNETAVRPLVKIGEVYQASIPVVMENTGVAGNVASGTSFSTSINTDNLVAIAASNNFTGGREANSAADMAAQYFDSRVLASMGPRDQIISLLRSRTDVGDIRQVGIAGFGDPEMHRDKTRFIPGGGGRTDLYLASGSFPSTLSVSMTAKPTVRTTAGPQQYLIEIGRDVAPGFLEVAGVIDSESGMPLTVVEVNRGMDLSAIIDEQVPTCQEISQATFSRFQTATLRIEDSEIAYSPSNTDSRVVQVNFLYQPGLRAAQSLVGSREWRFSGGDTLVRGAIPLTLSIVVRMTSQSSPTVPEATQLREAILTELYGEPMRTAIYASDIVAVLSPYIRPYMSVNRVDFYGSYVHPQGHTVRLHGTDSLILPNLPNEQVTPRTMAIYSISDLIKFTVEQLLGPEIP